MTTGTTASQQAAAGLRRDAIGLLAREMPAAGSLATYAAATCTRPFAGYPANGVIAGSVYTVLAFGGFEGAAPLAEETRDPRRTVQRAVLLATLGIGILHVFTTYAASVAHARQGESEGAAPTPWPRLENDSYVMSAGSARPLEDAFRIAQHDMVGWVSALCGLDPLDAYQLRELATSL